MPHGRQPISAYFGDYGLLWMPSGGLAEQQTLSGAVPNHVAALYPTTCLTCHTTWVTTGWLGATFNHTWFAFRTNGSVCSDCHLVSTDYAKFSCIDCHTRANAHNKGSIGPEPSGLGGYVMARRLVTTVIRIDADAFRALLRLGE